MKKKKHPADKAPLECVCCGCGVKRLDLGGKRAGQTIIEFCPRCRKRNEHLVIES